MPTSLFTSEVALLSIVTIIILVELAVWMLVSFHFPVHVTSVLVTLVLSIRSRFAWFIPLLGLIWWLLIITTSFLVLTALLIPTLIVLMSLIGLRIVTILFIIAVPLSSYSGLISEARMIIVSDHLTSPWRSFLLLLIFERGIILRSLFMVGWGLLKLLFFPLELIETVVAPFIDRIHFWWMCRVLIETPTFSTTCRTSFHLN